MRKPSICRYILERPCAQIMRPIVNRASVPHHAIMGVHVKSQYAHASPTCETSRSSHTSITEETTLVATQCSGFNPGFSSARHIRKDKRRVMDSGDLEREGHLFLRACSHYMAIFAAPGPRAKSYISQAVHRP